MRRFALLCALLAACSKSQPTRACHDRVQTMAAHLAAPRTLAEIRAGASSWLASQIDAAKAHPGDAAELAKVISKASADCPDASQVFAELGGLDAQAQRDLVTTQLPPALERCGCKASPEDVGGMIEAILAPSR